MIAYVYLESLSFVSTWVNGGLLPISSIYKYKCEEDERDGNLTPDEGLIDTSTHFQAMFGISATNSTVIIGKAYDRETGRLIAQNVKIERYNEKGIVLCASRELKKSIADKFKRKYCVKINDFRMLQDSISKQLGVSGKFGICKYTSGHKRNCFLKSSKDYWQQEVRIFWKDLEPTKVELPAGLAVQVEIPNS